MKKRFTAKIFILALMMALALSGCGQKGQVTEKEKKKETPVETTQPLTKELKVEETLSPEQMDLVKYNYYVQLNNELVKVLDDIENYFKVVADQEDFSLIQDSGLTYGYRISSFNTDIIDDCLYLSDMEPAYETLDELMKNMAEPLRELMEAFSDVSRTNDYAANQYQKAKDFHAVIYPITGEVAEMAGQFMDEISIIANERVIAEEEKLKSEGKLIAYNASHALTIAELILDECARQDVSDENITELDLTNIKPLYEDLVATVSDLNAATADNNQLMKESISNSRPFDLLYERMIDAVDWMIKQVESGQPIEDISLEPLGSIAFFSETISDCIDRYNSVIAEQ